MTKLTPDQQLFLLDIARLSVEAAAGGQAPPDPTSLAQNADVSLNNTLSENRGVFVTLSKLGQLRGCIGYIEGFKPLFQAVIENGRSAAVGDPRFRPLELSEVPDLEIEISVLTPLVEVASHQEIEIGKHGILLEKQGRQAVFLPQVATEQNWDLAATLSHLAQKAGFGPDGWQQDTRFRVFEAEVF